MKHGNVQIAELFLDTLEKTATPELKNKIQQIRCFMEMPDCAEMFRIVLTNAVGGRIPIDKETIHRGINCVDRYNRLDIDKLQIADEEKELRKELSSAWIHYCEQLMLLGCYQQGLLIRSDGGPADS